MVGSGRNRAGKLNEGPSKLDVYDAVFMIMIMKEEGSPGRLELRVIMRSAKNDQEGVGDTAIVYVYEDELDEGLCATHAP